MTFMSSLAANPGGAGVYGQPNTTSDQDVLGIVNRLKDREMQDFQTKANFMSDLSLKQDRLRKLYNPADQQEMFKEERGAPSGQPGQPGMNVVQAQDPNQITAPQRAELGIRQQGVDVEKARLAQSGKLGQEAIDVRSAQEKLNQQKSDQINANKQADLERKIEEANGKLELAQKALTSKNTNAESALKAHEDMAKAIEERHKLEIEKMNHRFEVTSGQHQQTIDNLTEQLKQRGRTKQTTELDSSGNKKTVTTERGSAADTVNVIGKDDQPYTIPKDKLNDKDADGTPHWKQQDQSENQ